MIQHISAVTLAVQDMARSVAFWAKLGFNVVYGGSESTFTSLQAGDAFVNLAEAPRDERQWWGRVIFRVDDADAQYRSLVAAGLNPEMPRDASWGERFFHIRDPDGHELSFAELRTPAGLIRGQWCLVRCHHLESRARLMFGARAGLRERA